MKVVSIYAFKNESFNLFTVNICWVIQRLVRVPNDRKCGCDVRLGSTIVETHRVAVDRVGQQLCVHLLHSTFDVELANEPSGHDELRNVFHFHQNPALLAGRDQNVGGLGAVR